MRKAIKQAGLILLTAVLLTGCGNEQSESAESTSVESVTREVSKEAVSKEQTSVEAPTEELSETVIEAESVYPPVNDSALKETILADYEEAYGYWWWFSGGAPMNYEYTKEEDSYAYCEFDYPGITTMDEFKKFLRKRFTEEIIESKLEGDFFKEFDGRLYVMDAARGSDISIDHVDYEVFYDSDKNEGEIVALIYRQDYDEKTNETYLTGAVDQEHILFTMEDDGAVFSTFPTIW